jgi:hypothetical protein
MAVGAVTAPSAGSSPRTGVLGVERPNSIGPRRDVDAPGSAEVEQYGPSFVQQGEDPQRAVGGDDVEIGHAASEQRMSLAEVVVNVQAGHHSGEPLARLIHPQQLGHDLAQGVDAFVDNVERDLRHGMAQHTGGDWVALGLVGVQEAVW